jgi:hypothetical protein
MASDGSLESGLVLLELHGGPWMALDSREESKTGLVRIAWES